MPEGNVEIVRRAVEALNNADVEAALALMTEDACFMPLRSKIEGAFNGHDGIRAFFADNEECFDVFEVRHDEIHDFGDRVVAIGRTRMRSKGSGVETEVPSAGVAIMRDGKIARWEDFGDRAVALGSLAQ